METLIENLEDLEGNTRRDSAGVPRDYFSSLRREGGKTKEDNLVPNIKELRDWKESPSAKF